jgi:hypothetical protein
VNKELVGSFCLGAMVPALALSDAVATLSGFVPRTGFYVPAALAITTIAYLVMRPKGIGAALASAVSMASLMAVLFVFPFGFRKQFVRSVYHIKPGTTRAEVARILGGYTRGHPFTGENHGPIGTEQPDVDYWHHGRGGQLFNYDHCVIHYGPRDHVGEVELHLD